jgi:hypothetical protein
MLISDRIHKESSRLCSPAFAYGPEKLSPVTGEALTDLLLCKPGEEESEVAVL